MTPFQRADLIVSESDDEVSKPRPRIQARVSQAWRRLRQQSSPGVRKWNRLRPCGNVVPQVGQACLIWKGKTGVDEGQVGVISEATPAMAWVTYPSDGEGGLAMKLKRPGSLIMLDPMITVSQDIHGTLWIRPLSAKTDLMVTGDSRCDAAENNREYKYY